MAGSSVQVLSPAPRDVWDSLIQRDGEALVSQSPGWTDLVCREAHYTDASRLYLFPNSQQILLPLVRKTRFPFISTVSSMPHAWDVGGILSARSVATDELRCVFEDLAQLPDLQVMIRPNPLHHQLWESAAPPNITRTTCKSHVLDLTGGFEVVWRKRFLSGTRNAMSKAERRGVTIESDTTGSLVPIFYELFHKAVARWAKIQHEPTLLARTRAWQRDPRRKFEALMTLGGQSKIWLARVNGQPAAALLVLQKANAQYVRGVMAESLAGPAKANYLLHKYAIEDACRLGCRRYHMGESGNSQTLAFFKTRFGAEGYPYYEYCLERMPISKANRLLREAVKSLIGFRDVKEPAVQGTEA